MKTAKEIREKCDNDIKQLQKTCKHLSSTWCEDWSIGIGHAVAGRVKVCSVCEKVLKRNKNKIEEGKAHIYSSTFTSI